MLVLSESDVADIELLPPVRYDPSPGGTVDYPWTSRTLVIRDSRGREVRVDLFSARGYGDTLARLQLTVASE